MKKTYISPALRTIELGSENAILNDSTRSSVGVNTTQTGSSLKSKKSGSPIWDNNLWGTADKD